MNSDMTGHVDGNMYEVAEGIVDLPMSCQRVLLMTTSLGSKVKVHFSMDTFQRNIITHKMMTNS